MRKDTKAMIVMVVGTLIVSIGGDIIMPTSFILGFTIGAIGCVMICVGAFVVLKSMFKSFPEIIALTKEVIKNRNLVKK